MSLCELCGCNRNCDTCNQKECVHILAGIFKAKDDETTEE